jgi:hypothetical protein
MLSCRVLVDLVHPGNVVATVVRLRPKRIRSLARGAAITTADRSPRLRVRPGGRLPS